MTGPPMERLGEYRLLRDFSEGGTGRLYVARHQGDATPCVVKVIHERFRKNSLYVATLLTESESAIAFRHPVALALQRIEEVEGGLYIAMERVIGPSWRGLRERARAAGRTFSVEAIFWMGARLAAMLDAAQQRPWSAGEVEGLLIGQVAPAGVLISISGEVKVPGVGLGRSRSCLPPTRSRLAYRAPELFRREPARAETDIYGLGMVLYDALAGIETFERDSVAAVKAAVLDEVPARIHHIPPTVDAVLRSMTAKMPKDRIGDLAEVSHVLQAEVTRSGHDLASEWAEHVRVLYPDLSVGGRPAPRESSARRVSVPYSQTVGVPSEPRAVAAPPVPSLPPVQGNVPTPSLDLEDALPPVAGAEASSGSYDIEDLAEILATADIVGRAPAPAAVVPADGEAKKALEALDDGSSAFDVDSVVDAILAGGSRSETPRPAPPSPPPTEAPPESAPRKVTGRPAVAAPPPPPPPSPWDSVPDRVEPRGTPYDGAVVPREESEAPLPFRSSELPAGSVIHDRYRILGELGRGGMSIVYRAEHTLLLKEVAVKLLRPELTSLENVVERFQREARSVCQLDDPNIVRVTDFGHTADGLLYLVMDLVEGEPLSVAIEDRAPFALAEALTLVDQILSGLEHAHRYEIVHRDLKPENIMLVTGRATAQVKILDFGIAKLGRGEDAKQSITQAGTVFGTPRYMSPEQAAGEPVDHRTDLYTVGVILYQLLVGTVPFDGESTVQLLAKVLTQQPPPMVFSAPNEEARSRVEALTMRALAKEPDERFPSAQAFRQAIDACLVS